MAVLRSNTKGLSVPYHYGAVQSDAHQEFIVGTPVQILNIYAISNLVRNTILMTHQSLNTPPILHIDFITSKNLPEPMAAPVLSEEQMEYYMSRCQIMTILSSLPDARNCLFGEKRTHRTTPYRMRLCFERKNLCACLECTVAWVHLQTPPGQGHR
jgi:hypothetical protein